MFKTKVSLLTFLISGSLCQASMASPLALVPRHTGRIAGLPSVGFHGLVKDMNHLKPKALKSEHSYPAPVPFDTLYQPKPQEMGAISQGAFVKIIKSSQTLLLINKGKILGSFPVSTGKYAKDTPIGTFRVISKVPHPPFYGKHLNRRYFPPKHKNNPLGTRWMQINRGHYQTGVALGLHGTDSPHLLGKPVSGGCIRMHNKDINAVFSHLKRGAKVVIVK